MFRGIKKHNEYARRGGRGKKLLSSLLSVAIFGSAVFGSLLFIEGCGVPENLRHLPFLQRAVMEEENSTPITYDGPAGMKVKDVAIPEVTLETPRILTDRYGYLPESDKTCILVGDQVPDTFYVMDADTGITVYEGKVTRRDRRDGAGNVVAYGYFTAVNEPGKYMICCDHIGYSYPFEVGEDVYTDNVDDLMAVMKDAINLMSGDAEVVGGLGERCECGNVITACQMCSILLLSYEFYPDYYGQYLEGISSGVRVPSILEIIRSNTDWLFTMQDPVSGGVYAGRRDPGGSGETLDTGTLSLSLDATALYAAMLSKFAYTYQYYDTAYTNKCIRAAELAYRYLKNKGGAAECFDEYYFAMAELYRLTGSYTYRNDLDAYREQILSAPDDASRYLADVTYLTTKRKVDKDVCEVLTNRLMKDAEATAAMCSANTYLAAANKDQSTIGNVLWNVTKLSIVNYVITNHEYITHLENNLHYLLGANAYCAPIGDMTLTESAEYLMLINTVTAKRDPITGN